MTDHQGEEEQRSRISGLGAKAQVKPSDVAFNAAQAGKEVLKAASDALAVFDQNPFSPLNSDGLSALRNAWAQLSKSAEPAARGLVTQLEKVLVNNGNSAKAGVNVGKLKEDIERFGGVAVSPPVQPHKDVAVDINLKKETPDHKIDGLI